MEEIIEQAAILRVGDDENTLKLLKALLAAEGYAVRSAANGEEALAPVAEQLPDLFLRDLMMPGIDGFEVAPSRIAEPQGPFAPKFAGAHHKCTGLAAAYADTAAALGQPERCSKPASPGYFKHCGMSPCVNWPSSMQPKRWNSCARRRVVVWSS